MPMSGHIDLPINAERDLQCLQLDLFSWDTIKIGEGFEALSRLDFEGAKKAFEDVLLQVPCHPSAKTGIEVIAYWEGVLHRLESLGGEDALVYLWENIKGYPFERGYSESLKKALIERLLMLMDDKPHIYIPPDICSGYLYIKLGRYKEAENALHTLLKDHPFNGRLMGYLGDTLWMQGRMDEARSIYAKALLLAPFEVSLEDLRDKELLEIVEDEGPEMAPIYGWLRGVLPLVDVETKLFGGLKKGKVLKVYTHLRIAEDARKNGNHKGMVAHRKMLKEEAPEVFNAYMEHLKGLLL